MSAITLTDLTKTYANGFTAVRGITLAIRDREFMVLVGPSGCGKTTTLRMIAGLEDVTRGEIRIGERRVNEVEPKDRDIAMVFQNYALYPHMTVFENMAYALTLRRTPRAQIEEKVRAAAQLLGLVEQLPKQPKQLSGGQRQRVAVGRAIVREPKAFLFDEPLSNLDAKLRTGMRYELKTLQRRLQTTMVYVTHDQVEAMTLGDRITVMSDGEIQQVAPPTVIYGQPWNRFVAAFIGTPAMNFLSGVLTGGSVERSFTVVGTPLRLTMPHQDRLSSAVDQPTVLGVRPEHLVSVAHQSAPADASILSMQVRLIEAMGDHQCVYLAPADNGTVLTMTCDPHHRFTVGERLDIAIDTRQAHVFADDGEFAPNLTLPPDFARQQ